MTLKDIEKLKLNGQIEKEASVKVAKAWKGLKGETVLGLFPNEIGKLWYFYDQIGKKFYKYQSNKDDLKLSSEMLEDFSSIKYQIPLTSMTEVIIQDETLVDSRVEQVKKIIKLVKKKEYEIALKVLDELKNQFN